MAKSRLALLTDALRDSTFVRIERRFENYSVRGYVAAVGRKFFVLELVRDRIWFDGFECFRISDVKEVKADPFTSFVESALKKRNQRRSKNVRVDVSDIRSILTSASRDFPLVAIHREVVDPGVCHIGRVAGFEEEKILLHEIGPGAKWEQQIDRYRLADITCVSFGGDYERALHMVGGNPPKKS